MRVFSRYSIDPSPLKAAETIVSAAFLFHSNSKTDSQSNSFWCGVLPNYEKLGYLPITAEPQAQEPRLWMPPVPAYQAHSVLANLPGVG